ncbi:hypothetical protein M885DRAFT_512591 [Pelagophyceae sp. CCMP2097]|nr:hypothetical protein M885DRAFT_512591 [Pelagophyceae sp. CCMP2097]
MCVVPGVCGFAAFSPRLDANGNSTRGVLVARSVSEILGLHVLHQGGGKPGNDGSRSKKSHPARKKMLAAARAETAHHSDRSLHLSDRDLREPGDARAGSQRDLVGSGRDLRARPSDRDVRLTPRGRPARIEPLANFGGEHAGDEESKGGDPQDDVRLAEEP